MSSSNPQEHHDDSDPEVIDPNEVAEEFNDDGDVAMDSDDEMMDEGDAQEEIQLHNDSIAYFDSHKDSVFTIAQHPKYPALVATGGGEGEEDDAPGKGYVIDTSAAQSRPVLPPSYSGEQQVENTHLQHVFEIDGHTDSINALTFTLPNGDYLVSAGLDGQLRAYSVALSNGQANIAFVANAQEVEEINWVAACPSTQYPNAIALGASDGSVWVYTIENGELSIVQTYYLHTGPCTAGAWTPDGSLLATVSEDGSLHVYDVWGFAGAKGLVGNNGQTVVSLTEADQRFAVEGGLYSVAVAPTGGFLACGGAGGAIKIVSLPRLTESAAPAPRRGAAGKSKGGQAESSTAGTILASLHTQADGVEALSFAPAPHTLLAAGSVDGSIGVYDTARGFALRKLLRNAHEDFSVVKVEFVRAAPGPAAGWLLTSCGMDGVVRRWDLRGAAAGTLQENEQKNLVKEWRGHRGDGEGGGVLGFVQGETGERIVTAGDDGVVLVFEA
jgi:ribosome assembly protein SQT1